MSPSTWKSVSFLKFIYFFIITLQYSYHTTTITLQLQKLHQIITLQYNFKAKRKENIRILKRLQKSNKRKHAREKDERKYVAFFGKKKKEERFLRHPISKHLALFFQPTSNKTLLLMFEILLRT